MASRACTRMVSPTPALTSATLTSSSPAPVSTMASSSSSSRTIRTATAVSEQVMQTSSWHSGMAAGAWAAGDDSVGGVGASAAVISHHPRSQHARLLEEHVHQLPQHVVGGDLDLLDDPGIGGV